MVQNVKMIKAFKFEYFQLEKLTRISFIILVVIMLTSCATHTPEGSDWEGYGFFSGWIHGLLFPFALIAKFMSFFLSLVGLDYMEKFEIIGDPNSGTFYYVGYVIGLIGSFFGGKRAF